MSINGAGGPREAVHWPLAGYRVLELGNFIAAPTAGRLLADFGAEVIKVERPGVGDEIRKWRLYRGDTSMLYRTINRNKKSITLDLRSTPGRQTALSLIGHCDAVIENFRPGTLEKWGMGPDVLAEANPDLILTRVSAFGQTGPLRERPGFAAVAEAMGGLRALVGEPDHPPSRVGVSIGDTIAGLYAAFGTVMQLLARQSAQGSTESPLAKPCFREVDVALNEAVYSVMESLVPDYDAYGVLRNRAGGRIEGIAPSNAYVCLDGDTVVIAGNGDAIFRRFMKVIGRPDLAGDPRLVTNSDRWNYRDELDDAIAAWVSSRRRAEVLACLDDAGVPAGPVYSAADLATDKQLLARNMIQYFEVDTGNAESARVAFPGVVPVLNECSLPIRHVGPELGQDTAEVLSGVLGMSAEEIEQLC
ncbi:CaiB/BaiF CoA transferase family protein [Mycobacterium vicinigordonae]|uniref:CoA transferase n=1 Tax=Mycobacterium vicinigordonae TaxID=1719132 RepID=A0A7D6E332_9MYCO|nr:CaiB/BaiF CoA-transferase family protein [Mycobacterium vicinigordonae]QLL06162.1 CoA transferase [Mycobacterium vicinigordonae]